MRLRPGPLTDASAVFGVGWLVALIIEIAATRSFNTGFQSALTAVPLMFMPSFALWALVRSFVRRKSAVAKFLGSISVSSALAIAVILMLGSALASAKASGQAGASSIEGELYVFVAGYYIGAIAGAAATYFWLTREKR